MEELLEIVPKKEKKQHIWVEKYRPKVLSDYLGNDVIKETFKTYIQNQDFCHLFLYGPPGTGKCLEGGECIDIEMDVSLDEYEILKKYEILE